MKTSKSRRLEPHFSVSPTLPKLRKPTQTPTISPRSPNDYRNLNLRFALLGPLPPIKIKGKHKDIFNESPINAKHSDEENSREICALLEGV